MSRPTIGALLDEIEATEQRATYAVLADALVEAGDARGELMQVQLALDASDAAAFPVHLRALPRLAPDPVAALDPATRQRLRGRQRTLRRARATALLGPLAKRKEIELAFRYGLLARVKLEATTELPPATIASTLATLFRSNEARLLRTVELAPGPRWGGALVRPVVDALLERRIAAPPALRCLQLGHRSATHEHQSYDHEGEFYADDLARLLEAFPAIHELWIDLGTTKLALAPLASEHLRYLTFATPFVQGDHLDALACSTLPHLQSFVVWTGAAYYVNRQGEMSTWTPPVSTVAPTELEPVLAMLDGCPELVHLGILNHADDLADLTATIAGHPLARRLTSLDLSYADRVDVATLAPRLAGFPALRSLVLEGVAIARDDQRRLENDTRQLVGGTARPDGQERYRYVTHQE